MFETTYKVRLLLWHGGSAGSCMDIPGPVRVRSKLHDKATALWHITNWLTAASRHRQESLKRTITAPVDSAAVHVVVCRRLHRCETETFMCHQYVESRLLPKVDGDAILKGA